MALLGQSFEDPRSAAIMGLLGGLRQGDFVGALLGGNQAYGQAQNAAMERQFAQAKLGEIAAMAKAREMEAAEKASALDRARRQQEALPGLFRQPGMTGGQAMPQEIGGVPMFSKPLQAAPMQATPGGFDVQGAIRAGFSPEQIKAYAGLGDIGRPKATRQIEVDDGRGGKRIALVDDYGQEVAGLPGYIAPVQVNQGDKVTFTRPQAGVSLPVGMSPSDRDASARGWASVNQGAQRLAMDAQNNAAGKAPAGYRWGPDGTSLVAIPGGPADKQAVATEGERKAATLLRRLEGSQSQLAEVLKTTPGAAKPGIVSDSLRSLGAPTAANFATPEARQRVEAAQLDILDAALTLGTGAAYTREQLEGYRRSYFPQLGDDPKTVQDKQARLQNVIEAAKIAAGRAGGSVAAPAAAAPNIPPGVTPLKWDPATRTFK